MMPMARQFLERFTKMLGLVVMILIAVTAMLGVSSIQAGEGTEFPGTVVMVDYAAGKLAVKKDGGGTRFTFTTSEKTKFGGGLASINDVKKDDRVVVIYQVQGSIYSALSVTKK